jgi:post-segregation antitoxin (ccd killing protein)
MGDKVRTHVSIESEQKQWAEDNHVNLSSLLREAIEQRRD